MNTKPDFKEFEKLYRPHCIIPLYRELLADLETPVSILSKLAGRDQIFLLESVEGGERHGRYSFIALNPYATFTVEAGRPYLTDRTGRRPLAGAANGFAALRQVLGDAVMVRQPGLPPLAGGAIGCLNFEAAGLFEELPPPKDHPERPVAQFMLTDEMITFDNMRHTLLLSVALHSDDYPSARAAYDTGLERLKALAGQLGGAGHPAPAVTDMVQFQANMSKEEFCRMVERGKAEIAAGEAIQLVLSQRFQAPLTVDPVCLYRALRLVNPSPYMYFCKNFDRYLIGSSPETMVKLQQRTAGLRPIAGTRRRSGDEATDRQLADELLRDEKERAEHLMLVDLGRNDLGRVAAPGSVQVRDFMQVERYSHVMHLVSNLEAQLDDSFDAFDLVRSAFPAGTLSGAPKIRAMELIRELEPESRGAYGGAVGYISYDGNLDLAITIRTMLIEDGVLSIQAGAGIVADSVPETEYQETLNKAMAMFKAVELAANGLKLN